jgi:carboxymethylenebutenolidase
MGIYLGMPQGTGPFPAVVVAQAAGGVDEFIQTIVDRLAGEGYAAVAPDLYHRTTVEIEKATGKTRRQLLDDTEIVADIDATVSFLQNHASVYGQRIGVTGFCMGGRVVWLAAVSNPNFKACVPFYGGFIMDSWGAATQSPFELSKNINCPMMFHFGEVDKNPSLDDMARYDEELTRLGKPHEFYVYPGADHRFLDHTFTAYQKEASELSWARTLDFFAANLKA